MMTKPIVSPKRFAGRFKRWLLENRVEDVPGPEAREGQTEQHSRWLVVYLTGVDHQKGGNCGGE